MKQTNEQELIETERLPVTYQINGDLLHLVMKGEYTPADIRSAVLEALEDGLLPENPKFLFDVSASQSLSARSSQELRSMAEFLASKSTRFRCRLGMLANQQLHFGLLRTAEVYSETLGLDAKVFYSLDEALVWLYLES